jgi:hypothetical protein
MNYNLPLFVLFGLISLGGTLWADPPARVGRLSFLEGTVSFSSAPGEKFETAKLNYPLTTGNLLCTGNGSRTEVEIGSTEVRLAADSVVSFDALDDQAVQMRLDKGSASVCVRVLDQGQTFQVDIHTASISLAAPGSYRIDQKDSGETVLTARTGEVEVTGGRVTFQVQAGQAATIPPGEPGAYRITGAPPPDAWDQWVAARDSKEEQIASTRYVPREMDGVKDLDNYGNWQVIDGYGPVWYPAGVDLGWAPYTLGAWSWCDPWGWSWVDSEPWGFAPFHYGRWTHFGGAWGWVPGAMVRRPYFAPGLVSWQGGRPGVGGWTPLGPRQPYHPWYHASNSYFRAMNGGGMRSTFRSGEAGNLMTHGHVANSRPWYNGQKSGLTPGLSFSSRYGSQGYGHSIYGRQPGFSHSFGRGFSRGHSWSENSVGRR